jgi:hypothetical protein
MAPLADHPQDEERAQGNKEDRETADDPDHGATSPSAFAFRSLYCGLTRNSERATVPGLGGGDWPGAAPCSTAMPPMRSAHDPG